ARRSVSCPVPPKAAATGKIAPVRCRPGAGSDGRSRPSSEPDPVTRPPRWRPGFAAPAQALEMPAARGYTIHSTGRPTTCVICPTPPRPRTGPDRELPMDTVKRRPPRLLLLAAGTGLLAWVSAGTAPPPPPGPEA